MAGYKKGCKEKSMNILTLQIEKEFFEKLISYMGSKPWTEVQHLIVPLLQTLKTDVEKVEEEIKNNL